MKNTIALFLFILTIPTFGLAQRKLEAENVHATQKLSIGKNATRHDFTSATDTISVSSTHEQIPTARSVWDLLGSLGGGSGADTSGYNLDFRISGDTLYIRDGDGELNVDLSAYRVIAGHVILEGNTPRAQKDSLEFRTTSAVALAATNESTRTVIEATLQSNSVNAAEISAGAVGNSELASNAVDSTKIANGGVSVLDLGQHGASSGQVLKWNGTQWAPDADNNSGGTVTSVGIAAPAAGITVSGSPVTGSGSMTLALADDLAALEGMSGTGIVARTASNTYAQRTITAGTGITVSNGNGVSGNPTVTADTSLLATVSDVGVATSGMTTGTGTSGFVPRWTGTSTLGRSDTLFWDNTNGRLGINTTTPSQRLNIRSTSGTQPNIRIESSGTIDQDVLGFEFEGIAAGPYTQRARIDMDVYSNAGVLPKGQSILFRSSTVGQSGGMDIGMKEDQLTFNYAGNFAIQGIGANNRIRIETSGGVFSTTNWLITSSAYTTADTSTRLRVIGRTQTSNTYASRWYDGGAQIAMAIRDDRRVGILTDAPNRTLEVSGEVRITDLTTDQATGIVGTDADGDLSRLRIGTGLSISNDTLHATGAGGVTDHGALTGLSDDDHSQYALLAGRSGGQTLTGGTASGDDLTLRSTTNATKGDIIIADQGGNVLLGGAATASELRFLEPSGSGSNYTAIKAQAQAGNVTITLPASDGAAGQVVKTDGSGTWGWATIVAPPGTENIESSAFTALKGIINQVDCSAGTITVNPPASPVIGDRFSLTDATASAGTNNITVDFDTANQNLYGIQQNYIINVDGGYVEFIYMGATTGWIATK